MAPSSFKLRTALPAQNISDLNLTQYQVMDVTADGFVRKVPKNEILTLALNERAVSGGRGFFFHLPSRDSLVTPLGIERLPSSRVPAAVRAQYASILYMDFVWSVSGRDAFFADTHRARYLKSSAIINAPDASVPLYAIQLATSDRSLLYATDSLVLFDTPSGYRLIPNSQADTIAGRYNGRFGVHDQDIALRIDTAKFTSFWKPLVRDLTNGQIAKIPVTDVEGAYREVLRYTSDQLPSSFTAGELRSLLPRPLAPEFGVALGTAGQARQDDFEPSSEPLSRRLITHKRQLAPTDDQTSDAERERVILEQPG